MWARSVISAARRRAGPTPGRPMPASCAASKIAASPRSRADRPSPARSLRSCRSARRRRRPVLGGLAEEHRRRGGAHHPGAMRLVERLEQGQPVVGGLGRRRCRSRRCRRPESRPVRAPSGTRGRPRWLLDDDRDVTGAAPASRRTRRRWRAGRRCRWPDLGDVVAEVGQSERSEFLCGRTCRAAPAAAGTVRPAGRRPVGSPGWRGSTSCTTIARVTELRRRAARPAAARRARCRCAS